MYTGEGNSRVLLIEVTVVTAYILIRACLYLTFVTISRYLFTRLRAINISVQGWAYENNKQARSKSILGRSTLARAHTFLLSRLRAVSLSVQG